MRLLEEAKEENQSWEREVHTLMDQLGRSGIEPCRGSEAGLRLLRRTLASLSMDGVRHALFRWRESFVVDTAVNGGGLGAYLPNIGQGWGFGWGGPSSDEILTATREAENEVSEIPAIAPPLTLT